MSAAGTLPSGRRISTLYIASCSPSTIKQLAHLPPRVRSVASEGMLKLSSCSATTLPAAAAAWGSPLTQPLQELVTALTRRLPRLPSGTAT